MREATDRQIQAIQIKVEGMMRKDGSNKDGSYTQKEIGERMDPPASQDVVSELLQKGKLIIAKIPMVEIERESRRKTRHMLKRK